MFSSALLFLDIGGPELMLILFVALLLFGGDKLPELARGLGKGIRDFKDASEGVKREINAQIDNFENKKAAESSATATETEAVAESVEVEEPVQLEEHTPSTYQYSDGNFDDVHQHTGVANTIPYGQTHVSASDKIEVTAPVDPYAFKNGEYTDEANTAADSAKKDEEPHKI